MPINKDQSKDIPGNSGYSYNDRKKLLDIASHPDNFLSPITEQKKVTYAQIFGFIIFIGFLAMCVATALIGN